jgi:hypothetical protein
MSPPYGVGGAIRRFAINMAKKNAEWTQNVNLTAQFCLRFRRRVQGYSARAADPFAGAASYPWEPESQPVEAAGPSPRLSLRPSVSPGRRDVESADRTVRRPKQWIKAAQVNRRPRQRRQEVL